MEKGTVLYSDMISAYENGAKYIIVFDSNAKLHSKRPTLNQLAYMKQFWQYVQANPRIITPVSDRTAYVLPANYAYGFRGPNDTIWGLWPADNLTVDISMSVATLLQMNGANLDIVYPSQTLESAGYQTTIYWNDTELIPTPSPNFPLPLYATTIGLYAIAASILVAVAVSITILEFRKRRDNLQSKAPF